MNDQNRKPSSASGTPGDKTRIFSINNDEVQSTSGTSSVMPSNDVDLNEGDLQILRRRRPNSSIARASSNTAATAKSGNQKPRVTVQSNTVPSASPARTKSSESAPVPGKAQPTEQSATAAQRREPRVTVGQTAVQSHPAPTSGNAASHTAPRQKAVPAPRTSPAQQTRSMTPENMPNHQKAGTDIAMQTRVIRAVTPAESKADAGETRQFMIPKQRTQQNAERTAKQPERQTNRNRANKKSSVSDHTRSIAKVKSAPSPRKSVRQKQEAIEYEYDDEVKTGGAVSSILKAVIYLTFVLVTSAILSYLGITVCNDVFAFVKSDTEQTVTIPENATVEEISNILKDADIIRYPFFFRMYAQIRHDNGIFASGDYTVSANTGYDELLAAFKPAVVKRREVQITIPEGYTVDQIIDLFVNNGIGTREGFVNVIQNFDYDFWFIDELEETSHPGRTYRLEGYLFPDTYRFYSDSDEKTVIYKLLLRFNELYSEEFRARATELGYTTDQIITLASMIQMEAKYTSEYGAISSVFHNRLNHPNAETRGRLESDATIQYVLDERHAELTQEDLELDSPYNTYMITGLPVGPISNPCYAAITYALSPSDTDYYYFVAQKNGYSLFAKTYQEHIQNKLKALG